MTKYIHYSDEAMERNLVCGDCYELRTKIMLEEDIINTPNHYTQWGIEPIDFI